MSSAYDMVVLICPQICILGLMNALIPIMYLSWVVFFVVFELHAFTQLIIAICCLNASRHVTKINERYHNKEVYFRNQHIQEALRIDFEENWDICTTTVEMLQSTLLVNNVKYYNTKIHFRNQRIKTNLYTKSGTNQNTPKYHTVIVIYIAANLTSVPLLDKIPSHKH